MIKIWTQPTQAPTDIFNGPVGEDSEDWPSLALDWRCATGLRVL
jgi:hypothetical protein